MPHEPSSIRKKISKNAIQHNTWWFALILLFGFLMPGAIPFSGLVEAARTGQVRRGWREAVAVVIGAVDCWAVLMRWPEGLGDLSWVSLYILMSAVAFIGLARSR